MSNHMHHSVYTAMREQREAAARRVGYVRMAIAAVLMLAIVYAYHLASKPMDGGKGDSVNWRSMAHEGAGRTR